MRWKRMATANIDPEGVSNMAQSEQRWRKQVDRLIDRLASTPESSNAYFETLCLARTRGELDRMNPVELQRLYLWLEKRVQSLRSSARLRVSPDRLAGGELEWYERRLSQEPEQPDSDWPRLLPIVVLAAGGIVTTALMFAL